MPVPTHFKFTLRGRFLNSPETWSFGFKMTRDNDAGLDAELTDINEGNVTSAVAAFMGTSLFSSHLVVDDWRAYVIGTDGKMEGNAPLIHLFEPALPGGSTGVKHPPQIAVVVTTVADNRGPAKLGRFYLPGVRADVDPDWRMAQGTADNLVSQATTFLKAVSDSIDMDVLQSSKGCNISTGPPQTEGTLQEIDHLEVGRVFDTLRNRRKSLLEARSIGGPIDW